MAGAQPSKRSAPADGAQQGKRKSARKNDGDEDSDSTVSPTEQKDKRIADLEADVHRYKKRAKFAISAPKKGSKKEKTLTAMQKEVHKRTKTDLFCIKKFFYDDDKLLEGTAYVMKRIAPRDVVLLEEKSKERIEQEEMWIAEYKPDVRIALNDVRNYVQQELRALIIRVFAEMDEDSYPNVEEIRMLMQRKGLVKGAKLKKMLGFLDKYWDELVPKVALHANWSPTYRHYDLLSTAKTVPRAKADKPLPCVHHTTEAFLVAIWENCYPKWRYQCLQKRKKEAEDPKHAEMQGLEYTTASGGRNDFGGWTTKGKDRVQELSKLAKEGREQSHVEVVEKACLLRVRYVLGANWYPWFLFCNYTNDFAILCSISITGTSMVGMPSTRRGRADPNPKKWWPWRCASRRIRIVTSGCEGCGLYFLKLRWLVLNLVEDWFWFWFWIWKLLMGGSQSSR
jgi:hypothetical protein